MPSALNWRHEPEVQPKLRTAPSRTDFQVFCLGSQVAYVQRQVGGDHNSYTLYPMGERGQILYGRIAGSQYGTREEVLEGLSRVPYFYKMKGKRLYGVSVAGLTVGTLEYQETKWFFRAEGGRAHRTFGFMDEVPFESLEAAMHTIVVSHFFCP